MTDLVIEEFPSDGSPWTVVEHGRVSWNHDLPDEPLVEICLLNSVSNEMKITKISKSFTLYATRGSVWLNGLKVSEMPEICERKIRISSLKHRQFISAWDYIEDFDFSGRVIRKYYIPPHDYTIPKQFRNCPYWVFDDDKGTEIIISHLALFDGTFGHSARAKQIAFNHSAICTIDRMEFKDYSLDDYEEQPLESEVVIGLNKDIRDNDRYFLHHLKTSIDAKRAVNGLHSLLVKNRNQSDFIRINPWFIDDHDWKVKGVWLDRGRRFLVLEILNFKYPPSPDFFVIRQNHNIVAEQFEKERPKRPRLQTNNSKQSKGTSKNRPTPNTLPTDIELSAEDEIMGGSRMRKGVPKENKTRSTSGPPKMQSHSTLSTSSMNKSKSETGKANLSKSQSNNDHPEDSKPRPVPNAVNLVLSALKVLTKDTGSVAYLNNSSEWQNVNTSGLSELYELTGTNSWSQNRTREFSGINGKLCYHPRRLGVFYVELSGIGYCFIAIERTRQESFRTAIYSAPCKYGFITKLDEIVRALEECKGVWKNLDDTYSPDIGLITHKGDTQMVSSQIKSKLTRAQANYASN